MAKKSFERKKRFRAACHKQHQALMINRPDGTWVPASQIGSPTIRQQTLSGALHRLTGA